MRESHGEVYRLAECYDIAFDFRDVAAECDFLTGLAREHLGRTPRSFLELAAGPGQHAREFAGRGADSTALDASGDMVEFAVARARERGAPVQGVRADMVDFDLGRTFDVAALLMSSCVYLLDNDAALRHLERVAAHLVDGGLYVLEMEHPRDVFGVGSSAKNEWDSERDGTRVSMRWGCEDDPFDPITQVRQVTVQVRFDGPEGSGVVEERAPQRVFTANEVRALVAASGRFRIVGLFGALDAAVPFSNAKESWRMVPVLQKVA